MSSHIRNKDLRRLVNAEDRSRLWLAAAHRENYEHERLTSIDPVCSVLWQRASLSPTFNILAFGAWTVHRPS